LLILILVALCGQVFCSKNKGEKGMDPLNISIDLGKAVFLAGEQITVTTTVENRTSSPVLCHDLNQGSMIIYQAKNKANGGTRLISYGMYQLTLYPLKRQGAPEPPKRELPAGGKIKVTEDLGTYAIPPLTPGTYSVTGTYTLDGKSFVSNEVPISIALPKPHALVRWCDTRTGRRASLLINQDASKRTLYHSDSYNPLPSLGALWGYYDSFDMKSPVTLSVALQCAREMLFRWIAWLQADAVHIAWVSYGTKMATPITLSTDFSDAKLLNCGAFVEGNRAFFCIWGQKDGLASIQLVSVDCKQAVARIVGTFPTQDAACRDLSVTFVVTKTSKLARFFWHTVRGTESVFRTMVLDLEAGRSDGPTTMGEIEGRVVAVGVLPIGDPSDAVLANALVEDAGDLHVVAVPNSTAELTTLASFRKPQGPVTNWAIGAGSAYSIPVVAVSDNYVLWNETKKPDHWNTLAHAPNGISNPTIHLMPDGLAARQYLKGKYWAEYMDNEGFKVVPIPSMLRGEDKE
jgi:hypothetical protein